MPAFSPCTRPRRGERILAQATAGMTVLLSLDGGQYYSLENVGSRIWELSDGSRTVADIAQVLASEYAQPPATIEADVLELLNDLAHEHLVEPLP